MCRSIKRDKCVVQLRGTNVSCDKEGQIRRAIKRDKCVIQLRGTNTSCN
jgi:hypothetical protein